MRLKDGTVRLAATRGAKLGALAGDVCRASFDVAIGGIERGHSRRDAEATRDARRMTANAPTQTAHRSGGESADGGKRGRFREKHRMADAPSDEGTSLARVGARDSLAEAAARVAALGVLARALFEPSVDGYG